MNSKNHNATATDSPLVQYPIVIVGGGTAGVTTTAQILKVDRTLDIALPELSDKHYYQPAWTLVGDGVYQPKDTVKEEQDVIPKGITWIKDYCQEFISEKNTVITRQGQYVTYDYLIIAAGIQINWHLVKGLPEALGKNSACNNYAYEQAPRTWSMINNFLGSRAIFTYPNTPIKCAGTPQKIMYLAEEAFQKAGVRKKSKIIYNTAGDGIFGISAYAKSLRKIVKRKNIDLRVKHNLIEIKPDTKEAIFEVTTESDSSTVAIAYECALPYFIKHSPLADDSGWVDVDKYTLQHNTYPKCILFGRFLFLA